MVLKSKCCSTQSDSSLLPLLVLHLVLTVIGPNTDRRSSLTSRIMREFSRLAADIGSHDVFWKVTNSSAIRAELTGLLGMLHLLFQDLDVSAPLFGPPVFPPSSSDQFLEQNLASRRSVFLNPMLQEHHGRVRENLARWDHMISFAASTDRVELAAILRNALTVDQLQDVLKSASSTSNYDVLDSMMLKF